MKKKGESLPTVKTKREEELEVVLGEMIQKARKQESYVLSIQVFFVSSMSKDLFPIKIENGVLKCIETGLRGKIFRTYFLHEISNISLGYKSVSKNFMKEDDDHELKPSEDKTPAYVLAQRRSDPPRISANRRYFSVK